ASVPRQCSLGVEQVGSSEVRRIPPVAGEGCLKRVANNRMDEPRRAVGCQHFETGEARSKTASLGHLKAGDCGRVTEFASVAEDGKRLRKVERSRMEFADARNHTPGGRVAATPA